MEKCYLVAYMYGGHQVIEYSAHESRERVTIICTNSIGVSASIRAYMQCTRCYLATNIPVTYYIGERAPLTLFNTRWSESHYILAACSRAEPAQ